MKKTFFGIAVLAAGTIAWAENPRFSRGKDFNGEYNTDRRDLLEAPDTFNAGKVNAITSGGPYENRAVA